MMRRGRHLLAATAAAGALAAGGAVAAGSPAEAAPSCAGSGYLCFYDYGSGQYGNVKDSNWNWRDFGWNDRADWFYNQGATHNAIIYEHAGYAGASRFLVRGATTYWYNTVSSNSWVR